MRVYSARTLAEVAVLKWHGVGCYAVAFAAVATASGVEGVTMKGEVGVTTKGEGGETSSAQGGGVEGEGVKGEGERGEEGKGGGDSVGSGGGGGGEGVQQQPQGQRSKEVVVVPRLVDVTVREKRERLAREGHWLAAGSKDGKVSLWDVF